MTDITAVTREITAERLSDALRRFVGPRRRYGYDQAADLLDTERRTLEAWALGQVSPCLHKFLRLCVLLGPDFANPVLQLAGMDGARCQDAAVPHDLSLNGDTASLMATLADALRDGHIDHRERAALAVEARHLHTVLGAWLAFHDNKTR